MFDAKAQGWARSAMGWPFYLYLFLVSMPVFINISRDGVRYASSVMKMPTGFSINVGLLLIPWFAGALLYRCFRRRSFKTGALGEVALLFLSSCLAVVLYGQSQEYLTMRWLILGQFAAPFFAYFYMMNFRQDIRLEVLTKLLVAALLLQSSCFLFMNLPMLLAGQTFDASMFVVVAGRKIFLYGVRDYYPILFLTLVIFVHHNVANKARAGLPRQAAILATVFAYGFSMIFHSRSLLLAIICVFGFYALKRSRQRPFAAFFVWLAILLLGAMSLRPSIFSDISSSGRLLDTIQSADAALQGKEGAFDAGGSTYLRFEAMTHSLSVFTEYPLTGIAFSSPFAAHSQYLSILALGGIAPFSLFLFLLWRLYLEMRRACRMRGQEGAVPFDPGGMFAILIVFIVSAFFQNNLTVTYTSCLFWALVGIQELGSRAGKAGSQGTPPFEGGSLARSEV